MHGRGLTKQDTSIIKGVSILLIATHNFMHLFPTPKHNEFDFAAERFRSVLSMLRNDPANIAQVVLAFFGHFGVQAFIFLSAYGLTKKYSDRPLDYWQFIRGRFARIYPAFLLAVGAWLVAGFFHHGVLGPAKLVYWTYDQILLTATLVANLIPGNSAGPVGPWWFIPFIFHFYLLFPLMRHAFLRWGPRFLIVASAASVALTYLGRDGPLDLSVTVVGRLPEFCLGIYLATKERQSLAAGKPVLVAALAAFALGNLYEPFWFVSHLSALVLLLAVLVRLLPVIAARPRVRRALVFTGSISLYLFLVNGFLRVPFIDWAIARDNWLLTNLLCLASLATAYAVALLLQRVESALRAAPRPASP